MKDKEAEMKPEDRKLMSDMRDHLLEILYGETRYSAYGHLIAQTVRRADVALGDKHYSDVRKSYPGPRKAAKRKVA